MIGAIPIYWYQINNDKISVLVCFPPLSSVHCSHFITQLVPPCSAVSCQQKENQEHCVEKVYSCKLKNWTGTSIYGATAPIYINAWKHVVVFFLGTRKKRNRGETKSQTDPQQKQGPLLLSFQKGNKYPDIATIENVSFTTQVEFSIWLIEWSSEKFYIQQW